MIKQIWFGLIRNIVKDKLFSFLNITNLIVGFATFILISSYVYYELNWDKHNKNYDQIYHVQIRQEMSQPINYCTYSSPAVRFHAINNLPEIEKATLMKEMSGKFITLPNNELLYDKNGYYAENSIFDIFTYHFIEGNEKNALNEPNTIVLSKELAKKIFPTGNILGNTVIIDKRYPLKVTGVYDDLPENSHIRPTYLVSLRTFEICSNWPQYKDNWTSINFDTYVLLKKGTDFNIVDKKIYNSFKDIKEFEKTYPYLKPLSLLNISPNDELDKIIIFSFIMLAAILVLILSCINYINLNIANSTKRAREIGIRKVVGFSQKAIAKKFMIETMVLVFAAMIIGIAVAQIAFPFFGRLLNRNIDFHIYDNFKLLGIIFFASITSGFLSGLYPSVVLSSYNPIKVLNGNLFNVNNKKITLKKSLTVIQFSISLFMLIISFILYKQVNFMIHKDMGFNQENILFAEISLNDKLSAESLRNRFLQHPEIKDVSCSATIPFFGNIGGYVGWDGGQQGQREMISRNYISYGFIPTFNIKIVQGRNFSKEYPSDSKACIINQTAIEKMNLKEPLGKQISLLDDKYTIIGVVKDFHPFTTHMAIPFYFMLLQPDSIKGTNMFTIHYAQGNEQKAKQTIKEVFSTYAPNTPFEFKDFSNFILNDNAIKGWRSIKDLFSLFAIIIIFIASIGLFGLVLFSTRHKMKEIGIRKVLGFSLSNLYLTLSAEFLVMLGISIFIAWPAAFRVYFALPGASKYPLSVTEFISATLIVLIIALITISYHVVKAAHTNPVDILKHE